MKPEEKAKELISQFRDAIYEGVLTPANIDMKREAYRNDQGRRCAIVHCTGQIEAYSDYYGLVFTEQFRERCNKKVEYWERVLNYLKTMLI